MSLLLARLQDDLNASRKNADKARTLLLGTIISDAKNRGIEVKRDLTDEDVSDVIRKGIKRRRESIEMFQKGNREELAQKERAEVEMLEAYLPPEVNPDDVRVAVRAAISSGASNIGAVMGKVMPQFKGRVEGGTISAIANEELSKQLCRSLSLVLRRPE
jgi:uncharacterized protein YqeY